MSLGLWVCLSVYVVASYVSGSVCLCVVASYLCLWVCLSVYVVASYVSGSVCLCVVASYLCLWVCLSVYVVASYVSGSVCVCVVASYVSGSVCVYVVASYVSGSVCVCVVASYVSGSVCLYVVASYVSGSVCLCMSWLAMSLGLSMCLSRHLSGFVSTDSVISISIFLHYITEPCCPSSSTLSKLPDKPAGELVPTCFILGPRECCPGLIRSSMLPRRPVCASQEMQHGRGMGGGWGSVMPPLLLQDTWSGWGTLCCHGTASHGLLHCRRLAGAPCMPAPSVNTPPPVPGGLTLGTAWRRWCRAIVPAPRLGNPLVPGRGSSLETP
ncbi:uncharacterized protein LOC127040646 isoform X1 [Gopherus flavomarginatus]|uniref:uncharacterized protein LOC127040646 isoform X1 n=1 Tax=Gopherus flavomarginatus TaxID=286002 RepID=UPI0021CBD86F|nr:uncharacterized protein LOC127040646 isoform X1 [Gopherus flavomarginatus]